MMPRKNLVPQAKSTATTWTLYDHSNDLCFIKSEAEETPVKSPRILKNEGDVEELQEVTTEETKAAIEKIVKPKSVLKQSGDSKHIKYTPSQQSAAAFNSGAKQRIFRVAERPVDPLDLSKFRHKRVPVASGSPNPVPVMHSPPRDVTGKELQDWKIPPCVSNWKNQKGYTIPLDQRLSADGRVLQEVQINDDFAKLSESLDVCEKKAREAVSKRLKVQREMVMKENERKEQELRALAQKARSERTTGAARGKMEYEKPKETREEKEERIQRDKIREERLRERRRVESKKSKITRDRDRDVSEKVALGLAFTGGRGGGDMYDQRLFNQEKGMDSGFATDERYNVYDKGLFTAQPTLSTLYRPKKDMDDEMYGNADERLDKLKNIERFKSDKAFTSASERAGKRDRPVEFEKESEEQDLFGLNRWVSDLKKGKKILNKNGSGWTF